MYGERVAANRIDRYIDLVAFLDDIKRGEGQVRFGPERCHDEFPTASR